MRHNYRIDLDNPNGVPLVQIDKAEIWDLVEYLSNQRIAANYNYRGDCFIVRFPHLGPAAAQALLDQWTGLQPVPAALADQPINCAHRNCRSGAIKNDNERLQHTGSAHDRRVPDPRNDGLQADTAVPANPVLRIIQRHSP